MPRPARRSGGRNRSRTWRTRPARRARAASTSGRAARITGCSTSATATSTRSTCAAARSRRSATGGRVSLVPAGARSFGWSSGPIVVGDVVVIAGNLDGAGDGGSEVERKPARGRARLRRAHRQAAVDLPRRAARRRVRRRHWGNDSGKLLGRSRLVVLHLGGRSSSATSTSR